MSVLKLIHVTCAALSISGFFYRGLLKLYSPSRLQRKWLKILPHVIDTLLLASAIAMVVSYQHYSFSHPWVLTKLGLLFLYILLGLWTLRFGKNRRQILLSFTLAITCYGYIVMVALTKQPWPFSDIL